MKKYLLIICLLLSIHIASAGSYTVGSSGDNWSGNVTFDNTSYQLNVDEHITLYDLDDFNDGIINPFWTKVGTTFTENFSSGFISYSTLNSAEYIGIDRNTTSITVRARLDSYVDRPILFQIDTTPGGYNVIYIDGWFRLYDGNTYNLANIDTNWHTWIFEVNGTHFRVFMDDTEKFSKSDSSKNITMCQLGTSNTDRDGSVTYDYLFFEENNYTDINYMGNLTCNYTEQMGADEELKTLSYNGLVNDIKTVDIYASTNNVTWVLENSSHPTNISLDVSGNGYKYGRWELNTTNASLTPMIYNITGTYETAEGTVDITYRELDYSNFSANVLIDISNKTGTLNYINLTHIGNLSSEYCLNYPNGTLVQSCVTCTNEGDTIWFNGSADRLPELNGYYINETEGTTIETFVVAAGVFAAVVVTGAAVVSRRVRRGASAFWNRRVRRR